MVLPVTSFAQTPFRLDGDFKFAKAELAVVLDVEAVRLFDSQRVAELRAQGYACTSVESVFRCTKALQDATLPGFIEDGIAGDWKDTGLKFTAGTEPAALTNDAEIVKEWDIKDPVRFNNAEAGEYHYYYLMTSGIHKAVVKLSPRDLWLVIEDLAHISTMVERTESLAYNHFRRYTVEVKFVRS